MALFTGRRHVYVKAYPPEAGRGLLNDIVGYLMARHAGVDQPPSGIISLPAETLAQVGIQANAAAVWCFVSTACSDLNSRKHGSLAALFNHDLQSVRGILENWPGFAQLVAFDTWLANVDRNTGNLIMTGKNCLVPIDHSDILTGHCWSFEDLVQHEDAWTLNKLVDIIWPAERLPLPVRSAILKSADRFQSAYTSAAAYAKDQSPTDRQAYADAESFARSKHIGLWASSRPTPPWDYRRGKTPVTAPSCSCDSHQVCTGPRGGRYCITSGGSKRYGG